MLNNGAPDWIDGVCRQTHSSEITTKHAFQFLYFSSLLKQLGEIAKIIWKEWSWINKADHKFDATSWSGACNLHRQWVAWKKFDACHRMQTKKLSSFVLRASEGITSRWLADDLYLLSIPRIFQHPKIAFGIENLLSRDIRSTALLRQC